MSVDPMPPRLTVRVEAPPERPRTTSWLLRGMLAASVLMGLLHPRSVGIPILLPALFGGLALWATRRLMVPVTKERSLTVRFFEDVLEMEGTTSLGRTPWEHVAHVYDHGAYLVVSLRSGTDVSIADEHVPGGRAALIAAMPPGLRIEPAPPPERPSDAVGWIVVLTVAGVIAYGLWSWGAR